MKKRKRSIKFNITLTFSIAMIIVAILTFLLVRFVSQNMLEAKTSKYLMGTVESNMDKIRFAKHKNKKRNKITKAILIKYKKGYLAFGSSHLKDILDYDLYQELTYENSPKELLI